MLLKKQTVWLLTMLSLVVVLSVYYITSPEQKTNDVAQVKQEAKDEAKTKTKTNTEAKDDKTIVSTIAGDAEFEKLRMALEESRSKQQEQLTNIVASTNLPADERSKAKDQMEKLTETAQKEEMLESFIKTMGYEDVLVRADGEKVNVTVKSKNKPSASEANKIILEVKKEIGETNFVAVTFQPSK
ncbi:SpoIIIAH-like family protein [Neobacillus dielmonensis]|uniref:SpoIIIAH-like family protein n=1 Tax=Neobacillus dielmonensis TaxID=1347369 RepID=UPI0005A9E7FC|nr:SpoIIIAH-like family protein [Neobacillus dielmonensis]